MEKRYWTSLLLGRLLLAGMLCTWNMSATGGEEVAVIVNPANPISSLSPGDLQKIFSGDKAKWSNGKHILLIMAAPGSPERSVILKNVYKMSEGEYAKYFLQATFTGAVSAPPKEATSAAQIKQLVAENPGAIGYINQQEVDGSVKVVAKVP
jgi:ABC-type phosphate transport system substrate-binding protein